MWLGAGPAGTKLTAPQIGADFQADEDGCFQTRQPTLVSFNLFYLFFFFFFGLSTCLFVFSLIYCYFHPFRLTEVPVLPLSSHLPAFLSFLFIMSYHNCLTSLVILRTVILFSRPLRLPPPQQSFYLFIYFFGCSAHPVCFSSPSTFPISVCPYFLLLLQPFLQL